MARRKKVIDFTAYRAKREAAKQLQSPEMRTIIFNGASTEFKHFIAPEIEKLLSVKDAPSVFRHNLIALLEKLYAAYHLFPIETEDLVDKINSLVNG